MRGSLQTSYQHDDGGDLPVCLWQDRVDVGLLQYPPVALQHVCLQNMAP